MARGFLPPLNRKTWGPNYRSVSPLIRRTYSFFCRFSNELKLTKSECRSDPNHLSPRKINSNSSCEKKNFPMALITLSRLRSGFRMALNISHNIQDPSSPATFLECESHASQQLFPCSTHQWLQPDLVAHYVSTVPCFHDQHGLSPPPPLE